MLIGSPGSRRITALVVVTATVLSACALLPPTITPDRPAPSVGPVAPPSPTVEPDDTASGEVQPALRLDPPRKWKGPFALDLYRRDAHVPQYTSSWCVGASMQMMINLMETRQLDRSRRTQLRLYRLARKISPWIEDDPGAGLYGWAGGLEQLGYGPFEEMAAASRQAVLRIAARQMRLAGKPVGLWVWRGKHAWVMSGFKATADPAVTDDFRVTHIWVEDPWSGRVSTIWGPGLAPHTLVDVDDLAADFLRWSSVHRPEYGDRGRFVILAPVV